MGNSPIVNRINALLAEKGISKQDFYRDCGITSASYSLWNTGKTTPRKKNLDVIAAYLDSTTDYLLTGLGEKEKAPVLAEKEGGKCKQLSKNPNLSDIHSQVVLQLEKMTEGEIKAVLAFINSLNDIEKAFSTDNKPRE